MLESVNRFLRQAYVKSIVILMKFILSTALSLLE